MVGDVIGRSLLDVGVTFRCLKHLILTDVTTKMATHATVKTVTDPLNFSG